MTTMYQLSDLQRRLWILWKLGNEDVSYNSNSAVEFQGDFQVSQVQRIFNTIIERHEALRTVFVEMEGDTFQIIKEPKDIEFCVEIKDCNGISVADLYNSISSEFDHKFDLEKGPLIKVCIWRIEEKRYIMLLSLHHIISDGWSIQNLAREFSILYNRYFSGDDCDLPPVKLHLKDFIYQDKVSTLSAHKTYWINKMSNAPLLQMPVDRRRPSVKSSNGERYSWNIMSSDYTRLKYFASEVGTSVFVVLIAALKSLIYKYTGQCDQVIGIPMANREEGAEAVIGCFVKTLLLRTVVEPEDNFYTLVDSISLNFIEAFEHNTYPFDQLLADLKIERDSARSPLFDLSVNYQEAMVDFDELRLINAEMKGFEMPNVMSKFDIEIDISEFDNHLKFILTFNKDLFDRWRIVRVAEEFTSLLFNLIAEPRMPLNDIEFISDRDRDLLINVFNRQKETAVPGSFVSVFNEVVYKHNHKTAVSGPRLKWTYQELQRLSNAVCDYLVSDHRITPGEKIAVYTKHDCWLFPVYIGIMKAGACFVPLNTSYPSGQLLKILKRDQISLVIANNLHVEPDIEPMADILTFEVLKSKVYDRQIKDPQIPIESEQTAYMIYTSGSTGAPKGVEISHGSMINYLKWANDYYYDGKSGYPTSLFTSLSSDLTITTLFAPLLRGDTIEIYDGLVDEAMARTFHPESNVRTVKLTPSHIALLSDADISRGTAVQVVIVGGEELLEKHVNILRRLNPMMKIYNEYGPTESTVGCIVEDIGRGRPLRSIGQPIQNTQAYILNDQLQLQPIGIAGEIYISGAGLSKGYYNNKALTNGCFLPVPFTGSIYPIMYKTGDLGLWNPEGYIEFLGRKDGQVKIKGHRIELGEIEAVLEMFDGVSKAVVIDKRTEERTFLVAYLIGDYKSDTQTLRHFLLNHFPEYMVPELFIKIEQIPLAPSGKIDKTALPEARLEKKPFAAACTPTEKIVAEIWQRILELDHVGIDDNFFEVGGNSISIMKIHKAIKENFGNVLSVVDLFRYNSVRSQSNLISEKTGELSCLSENNLEV